MRGTDFNDLHQAEGLDRVREIIKGASIPEPIPTTEERKFLFISAVDILSQPVEIRPLLGKVIERGTTGQLFGPSGGGKTFVVLDMACAVGTGREWNGNQCEKGLVPYFVGEGHSGIKRRIKAYHKQKGYPDLSNLHISRSVISFDAAGIRAVISEIRELEASTGQKVALIVVDTLARHLQGDENSTRDMSDFVRVVDSLRDAFPGSTVIIVHHTGNNVEHGDRSRGSSALKAACDFEIKCDKGLLTFTKVKDGEQPEPIEFKLVPVEIGIDDNGEPITSCIVKYGERSAKNKEVPLTAGERELLELVKMNPGILTGDLRTALFNQRKERDPDAKYDTIKKAFGRSLDGLIDKQKVFIDGNSVKEGQGTKQGHLGDMSLMGMGTDRDTLLKECPDVPPRPLSELAQSPEIGLSPYTDQNTYDDLEDFDIDGIEVIHAG